MKNLIIILIMVVAVGCSTSKSFTENSVVGSYETNIGGGIFKHVFLENGKVELHVNGIKTEGETDWKLVGKEVHSMINPGWNGYTQVFIIKPDGDLTGIAEILDGKRTDIPKDKFTWKKLK